MAEIATKTLPEVEQLIDKAIERINGKSAKDVCRYLPGTREGYMHHFTLKKLADTDPGKLSEMIHEFILNSNSPTQLEPPLRAPRASKQRHYFGDATTEEETQEIFQILMEKDRKDLAIKIIKQYKPFKQLQKELIQSIKRGQVAQDLWIAYTEALNNNSSV